MVFEHRLKPRLWAEILNVHICIVEAWGYRIKEAAELSKALCRAVPGSFNDQPAVLPLKSSNPPGAATYCVHLWLTLALQYLVLVKATSSINRSLVSNDSDLHTGFLGCSRASSTLISEPVSEGQFPGDLFSFLLAPDHLHVWISPMLLKLPNARCFSGYIKPISRFFFFLIASLRLLYVWIVTHFHLSFGNFCETATILSLYTKWIIFAFLKFPIWQTASK